MRITDIIAHQARSFTIEQAQKYYPELAQVKGTQIFFKCRSNHSNKSYQIILDMQKNNMKSQCSCGYSGGGLCPHIVASLQLLDSIRQKEERKQNPHRPVLDKKNQQKTPATKAISKPLYSLSKQNEIDLDVILQDVLTHCHPSPVFDQYHCVIDKFIEGKAMYKITFIRQAQSQTVELNCDCTHKPHPYYCEHLAAVVQSIQEQKIVLGANFLAPDFYQKKVNQCLQEYGLTLEDNYKKYLHFSMGETGFNVQLKNALLTKIQTPITPKISLFQPQWLQKKTPEVGLAAVFEFRGESLSGLLLVEGKYNKKKTALCRRFRPINMSNMGQFFYEQSIYSDEELQLFFKTEQLAKQIIDYDHQALSNESLTLTEQHYQGISLFRQYCHLLSQYPVYAHQNTQAYTCEHFVALSIENDVPVTLSFQLQEDSAFFQLQAHLLLGDKCVKIDSDKIFYHPFFILYENVIYPIGKAQLSVDINYYRQHAQLVFIKKNRKQFVDNILIPLTHSYEVKGQSLKPYRMQLKRPTKHLDPPCQNLEQEDLTSSKDSVIQPELQVYIHEENGLIFFQLGIQYPEKLIDVHSREMRIFVDKQGNIRTRSRDVALEQYFIHLFGSLHPDFMQKEEGYVLTPEQLLEDSWLIKVAWRLQEEEIKLLGVKNLSSYKYNLNKPSFDLILASGTDWFDVEVKVSFGEEKISLKEIKKAFVKKQNFIELGDGSLGILPDAWIKKLSLYFKLGKIKHEHLEISNYSFNVIDELYDNLEDKPEFLQALYARKQRLSHFQEQQNIPVPSGLLATLRPYQKAGLNWLGCLDENVLGGCLADDMGLGKTLQIICFLQYIKQTKKPQFPSLVIMPTSLVFNWENEIQKFCPHLKTLNFTGPKRMDHLRDFGQYDIILTTYGSVLKDVSKIKKQPFHYVILDESQAIKNPQSQRYKAVCTLNSYNRLILSGTPIENNTLDLFAQFNFINPGLLGSLAHFRKEFADPIDKNGDVACSELLAKMVSPFILRRTKEQVATELPAKIENYIYCEMGQQQRQVYDAVKEKYRDYLLDTIADQGIENAQMYILEGLMQLRQICNSPALLSGQQDYGSESIKLDILMENIKQKIGRHKILVFSSFVKMLKLIQIHLEAENIGYEYLDGQTLHRQQKVDNFQNNPNVHVFLISTKAGGTGLNLTKADYVFIVDPWWNPAVERQAIDRCYRIGQSKQVMAYRMICTNSIEEKILRLQHKKKEIAESIINVDERKKSFDINKVKDLFS